MVASNQFVVLDQERLSLSKAMPCNCPCTGLMLGAVPEARSEKGIIFQREELVVNSGSSFIKY